MSVTDDQAVVERIGKLEFTIACAEDTPESRRRWDSRIDALTSLLLEEWRLEQESKN